MPYATVNAKQLHYTDSYALLENKTPPSSSSPPPPLTLIFIHGLGSSQNYFGPVLPTLTPLSYRCITFDSYGAARSPYTAKEHSIRTIAADALGLLDALEVKGKVVIVGHSMGGIAVTELLSTAGERFVGGVAIGPVHPSEGVAKVFKGRIETVEKGGMETMANTVPYAATGSAAAPVHRAFIRELILNQSVEGYIANCRAIETATPPRYADVKAPLLIIAGAEDKSAPLEGCKTILGGVGSEEKRLEVLDGVGHWHCVEAGERVGELIKGFCEEVVGR